MTSVPTHIKIACRTPEETEEQYFQRVRDTIEKALPEGVSLDDVYPISIEDPNALRLHGTMVTFPYQNVHFNPDYWQKPNEDSPT